MIFIKIVLVIFWASNWNFVCRGVEEWVVNCFVFCEGRAFNDGSIPGARKLMVLSLLRIYLG